MSGMCGMPKLYMHLLFATETDIRQVLKNRTHYFHIQCRAIALLDHTNINNHTSVLILLCVTHEPLTPYYRSPVIPVYSCYVRRSHLPHFLNLPNIVLHTAWVTSISILIKQRGILFGCFLDPHATQAAHNTGGGGVFSGPTRHSSGVQYWGGCFLDPHATQAAHNTGGGVFSGPTRHSSGAQYWGGVFSGPTRHSSGAQYWGGGVFWTHTPLKRRTILGGVFSGPTRHSSGAQYWGGVFSGPTRHSSGAQYWGGVFSGPTRHSSGAQYWGGGVFWTHTPLKRRTILGGGIFWTHTPLKRRTILGGVFWTHTPLKRRTILGGCFLDPHATQVAHNTGGGNWRMAYKVTLTSLNGLSGLRSFTNLIQIQSTS